MCWKEVHAPANKAAWRHKFLRLLTVPPKQAVRYQRDLHLNPGSVVTLVRRCDFSVACSEVPGIRGLWMGERRFLLLALRCPHCGDLHTIVIPESWIAEGKAVFVEEAE